MKSTDDKKEFNSDDRKTALLLIDVISDFEFEDGEALFKNALPMAKRLAKFKERAVRAGIPVLYVNDNYGKWQEDFKQQVKYCLQNPVRGQEIVRLLAPDDRDFYVLKARHSGFYKTVLDVLLENLGIEQIILTGVTTDICVQFTAIDAYMRELRVIVPEDCVAAVTEGDSCTALEYMERVLDARIIRSEDFEFTKAEAKKA